MSEEIPKELLEEILSKAREVESLMRARRRVDKKIEAILNQNQ